MTSLSPSTQPAPTTMASTIGAMANGTALVNSTISAILTTVSTLLNASHPLQYVTNITDATSTTSSPTTPINQLHTFDGLILAKFNSTTTLPASDIIYSPACTALFACAYLLILAGGLLGNGLVCYVVIRNRAMQTVTNIFITNLAVSDILMTLLCVPFTPTYLYMRYWPFGMIMCHTVAYAQTSSVYISTFTLTAIAIDRYLVIMHPFRQRMRMRHCLLIVAFIWATSLLLALPFGMYQHEVPSNVTGVSRVYCEENWREGHRRLFASGTTVIQFVVPFLVIAFCYTCVSLRLIQRAKQRPGHHRCGPQAGRKDEMDRDRKRRTNRMLVYMVLVFGAAWLPLNLINLLNDWFIVNAEEAEWYNVGFIVTHLLAMSSTCYNPVLYAWKNDNFRKEFQLMLPCFRRGRGAAGAKGALLGAEGTVNGGGGGGGGGRPEATGGTGGRWLQTQSGLTVTGTLETNAHDQPADGGVYAGGSAGDGGGGGGGGGGGTQGGRSGSVHPVASDDQIRLSDIEPGEGTRMWMPVRANGNGGGHPETHRLPSGVLETNFEGLCGDLNGGHSPRLKEGRVNRIRFEETD